MQRYNAYTYYASTFRDVIDQHFDLISSHFLYLTIFVSLSLCVCMLLHSICRQQFSLTLFGFVSLSLFYRKKNRTNDAIRMLKRCTEIDATYVQAHLELFRLHRGSQAALILTDAIKANPDNLELRLAFGQWLLNNGRKFKKKKKRNNVSFSFSISTFHFCTHFIHTNRQLCLCIYHLTIFNYFITLFIRKFSIFSFHFCLSLSFLGTQNT